MLRKRFRALKPPRPVETCAETDGVNRSFVRRSDVPARSLLRPVRRTVDRSSIWFRSSSEEMRVVVGSKSAVKLQAVRSALSRWDPESDFDYASLEVSSGVREQPLSLEETCRGARTRAEQGALSGELSIGLEGGVFLSNELEPRRLMQVCVCCVFDGCRYAYGYSPCFCLPDTLQPMLFDQGLDLNQAIHQASLSEDAEIGKSIGAVGLFSGGRVERSDYMASAVTMALIEFFRDAGDSRG